MNRLRSLRLRLIAAVIATTAGVVMLAAVATWMASARERGLVFDQAVRDQARAMRPRLEVIAWRHIQDTGLPAEDLPSETGFDDLAVILLLPDGRICARSAGLPDGFPIPTEGIGPEGVLMEAEMPRFGAVRWMTLSIDGRPPPRDGQSGEERPPRDEGSRPPRDRPASRKPAAARLVMVRPVRSLQSELSGQAWLLAGMSIAICVLTAALAAWVINRLLRPLRRLGDDIAGMEPGSHAVLAVEELSTELQPVQARINELLARVDEVLTREKQTTANIAHELRTPLSGLRAKLELALLRDRDPEQIASLCRQGLSTMTLLQGLVDNLLLLARLEAGQAELHREAVEVAEVVATAWSLHQVAAGERGLHLERAIEPALALTTDAGKLRAILSNLLSNAVAYADRDSVIRLEAVEVGGQVRILVVNDGATISGVDAERVFEPFWRGDAARTVESGHCGLGLPLVRRMATILGGDVSVAIDGRRFRVQLVLPIGL